ncbi:hypothetical protein E2562_004917 [Oryza meyeriana var. granulata]|uniref:Uncharacterized protein n=1 Tax=Oryza meyeriana var. granulata TaxID=110450 RepID=A0A6G1C4M4_9ORYZ|nr:hypothetical protein E2562_004917 [Oryza meyeriana var. granulata]
MRVPGTFESEEAVDNAVVAAYVRTFDLPLPPHVVAGLRSLTRLDREAAIPSDLGGDGGSNLAAV